MSYKKLNKPEKKIKSIRGIYKAYLKCPKFLLRLVSSDQVRFYLNKKGTLTANKDEAIEYRYGFDTPKIKIDYWKSKLGLDFHEEKV